MKTVDVPRDQWHDQLDELTRTHEGCLVSLDVLGTELGVQPEVRFMPLVGIWTDRPAGTIAITVAPSPDDQLTHVVNHARGVYIERTDAGADAAMEFQSDDGTTTLLTFRDAPKTDPITGFILR
jgi:hypothetical protein